MQWFDRRMAGWYKKGSAPKDERVEGGNGSSPEWRDGKEKGRSLGRRRQWFGPRMAGWYRKGSVPKREEGRAQRKERREKREERDKNDQDK